MLRKGLLLCGGAELDCRLMCELQTSPYRRRGAMVKGEAVGQGHLRLMEDSCRLKTFLWCEPMCSGAKKEGHKTSRYQGSMRAPQDLNHNHNTSTQCQTLRRGASRSFARPSHSYLYLSYAGGGADFRPCLHTKANT